MKTIQICIVSDHLEANIIPLLQLQPDLAVLVTTDQMQSQSKTLETILRQAAPNMAITVKNHLPSTDVEAIEEFALQLSEELDTQYPQARQIYNATGGTKPIAIIFSQVFSSDIIYTHTGANQIQWLACVDDDKNPIATQSVLTPEIYLLANGKQLRKSQSSSPKWQQEVEDRSSLTKWLANNMNKKLGDLIGILNGYIRNDKNQKSVLVNEGRQQGESFKSENSRKVLPYTPNKLHIECLQKMTESHLIDWESDDASNLTFQSKEACMYLSGGWLEEYAWLCATEAHCESVLCSAEITDEHAPKLDIRNEIDCLIVHNNRMLIIECKTKNFGAKGSSDSDTLTKLDSITQHSSGKYGKGLLLSARKFGTENTEPRNIKRAESLSIPVLAEADLKSLPETIKHWMNTGNVNAQ